MNRVRSAWWLLESTGCEYLFGMKVDSGKTSIFGASEYQRDCSAALGRCFGTTSAMGN
jgi:hypothetical protein